MAATRENRRPIDFFISIKDINGVRVVKFRLAVENRKRVDNEGIGKRNSISSDGIPKGVFSRKEERWKNVRE